MSESDTCVMENLETLNRLNGAVAGLGAAGLLGGDVGEGRGEGRVAGSAVDGLGIRGKSSSHS